LAESQDSPRIAFSQARAKAHFCRARYTDTSSAGGNLFVSQAGKMMHFDDAGGEGIGASLFRGRQIALLDGRQDARNVIHRDHARS
jgi:hypothetical protein